MGAHHPITQDQTVESQDGLRALDVPDRPFQVGDCLPMRMTARDMCRAFQIKHSRFYVLNKRGTFRRFELDEKIGPQAWSGIKVTRYLAGETDRVFGRKRVG